MAGASHSKHSKHGRSNRDRYGRRDVAIRPTFPILVIVCDDTATAPAYFGELQRLYKQYVTLRIVPASCQGASPQAVTDQAIEKHKKLKKPGGDKDSRDVVWAVLDLEGEAHRRNQAQAEKERAEGRDIRVALSDPCYEIWTLLHLEDTGASFDDCGKVISRVKRLWKKQFGQTFGSKAQVDYSKIISLRHKAAARAKQHRENEDQSWTEVYMIIENIESIVQAAGANAK